MSVTEAIRKIRRKAPLVLALQKQFEGRLDIGDDAYKLLKKEKFVTLASDLAYTVKVPAGVKYVKSYGQKSQAVRFDAFGDDPDRRVESAIILAKNKKDAEKSADVGYVGEVMHSQRLEKIKVYLKGKLPKALGAEEHLIGTYEIWGVTIDWQYG